MPECIVRDCEIEAYNGLSIRLRHPDTTAIWAPNLEAYVCDVHAYSGARIRVAYEATETGSIETHVDGGDAESSRLTPIRRPEHV